MSNSVNNGNTGQPSMSIKKKIKDLHSKYLFSIAYLTPQQEHVLLEEEKIFFKYVFENQDKVFSFNADNELEEFNRYTKALMINVKDNYLKVFEDRSLNINSTDVEEIQKTIYFHFTQLKNRIEEQIKTQDSFNYIKCVLICSSLLFLIRTTKRALFMFISEQPNKKSYDIFVNLGHVIEYIHLFILSIDQSVIEQNKIVKDLKKVKDELTFKQGEVEELTKKYNNSVKEITNVKNKIYELEQALNQNNQYNQKQLETQEKELQIKQKKLEELELLKVDLEKQIIEIEQEKYKVIQQSASDYENLNKQLKQCKDENNKLSNPEFQKEIVKNAIEDSKNYKDLFSGIINLSIKFNNLLDRWDKDTENTGIIYTKIKNYFASIDENTATLVTTGSNILTDLYGDVSISLGNLLSLFPEEDNRLKEKFIDVAKLLTALSLLNNKQILTKSENMNIFGDSEDLYKKLVLLFEDLSGAVRVVVRVKNNQSFQQSTINQISQSGGKRKSRSFDKQNTLIKKYKTMSGGADPDFARYYINLLKDRMRVQFKNLPRGDLFRNENTEFGPFFSVHDSKGFTYQDDNVVSSEDDILKSIQFDTLKLMFEKKLADNEKVPALILYTYGYSGSGKTYTLFGKLGSSGVPPNGILWKMIKQLKEYYNVKLETTSKCYGYLKPSTTNNTNTIFNNETTGGYNKEINVDKDIQQDDTKWSEYILKLLKNTNDPQSFIKTTSNNPESSRGFLILKIGLYKDNILKGYIGVVDMAGNEDPYDIAASLCPTMDFNKMNNLIKSRQTAETKLKDSSTEIISISDYDTLYELVQKYVTDIIAPSIMGPILASAFALKRDLATIKKDIEAYNKRYTDDKISLKPEIANVSSTFPLIHSLSNDIERLILFITTNTIPNSETNNSWKPLTFTTSGKSKIVSCENEKIFTYEEKTVTLHLSNKFLLEVLGLLQKEYSFSSSVNIDDIKKQIQLNADINTITAMKIAYAMQLLSKAKHKNGYDVSLAIPLMRGMDYNIKKVRDLIKQHLKQQLRKNLDFDRQYFIPFFVTKDGEKDDTEQYYSYNIIKRIIREGFYINKANSELIEYFDKKLKMQKQKSFISLDTSYKFDENFSYINRSKQMMNNLSNNLSNAEIKNTFIDENGNKVNQYNTNLISLLTSMFPGNNKDILITCVRDDQEYGKVRGALDTLKLVEDLKST